MLGTIALAAYTTAVLVVPIDQVGDNRPPAEVYLHECGHALGAEDGVHALKPGTVMWRDPRFDCRLHRPKLKLEVLRALTRDTTEICRGAGGHSYACMWEE